MKGADISIITNGVQFVGDIVSSCDMLVEGRVVGNGEFAGFVTLTRTAIWCGDIEADVVLVCGVVKGNVVARNRVEFHAGAQVIGEIRSPRVAIKRGARVSGLVLMNENCEAEAVSSEVEQLRRVVGG